MPGPSSGVAWTRVRAGVAAAGDPDVGGCHGLVGGVAGAGRGGLRGGPDGVRVGAAVDRGGDPVVVAAPSKLQRPAGRQDARPAAAPRDDRVKTDSRDAQHVAKLLRMDQIVEVRVARGGTGGRQGPGPGPGRRPRGSDALDAWPAAGHRVPAVATGDPVPRTAGQVVSRDFPRADDAGHRGVIEAVGVGFAQLLRCSRASRTPSAAITVSIGNALSGCQLGSSSPHVVNSHTAAPRSARPICGC